MTYERRSNLHLGQRIRRGLLKRPNPSAIIGLMGVIRTLWSEGIIRFEFPTPLSVIRTESFPDAPIAEVQIKAVGKSVHAARVTIVEVTVQGLERVPYLRSSAKRKHVDR